MEKLDPAVGSKLADAVTYAQNQKSYLNASLEHSEVDISNNPAENAIRPFVVGRKMAVLRYAERRGVQRYHLHNGEDGKD